MGAWRKRPQAMPGRSAAPPPKLESVLGPPDFRIPCDRLIRASGSIVYAWTRAGRALYVGMSGNGLPRPLSASHDVTWAFQPGDQLLIWKAANREEARHQEFNLDLSARPRRPTEPLLEAEPATPSVPPENLPLFPGLP